MIPEPQLCKYCLVLPVIDIDRCDSLGNSVEWKVMCPICDTRTFGFMDLEDAVRTWNSFMEGESDVDRMVDEPPEGLTLITMLKVLLHRKDVMDDDIYAVVNAIESMLGVDRDAVIDHMDRIEAELDGREVSE